MQLGDWHALSDVLAYALKQNRHNTHALHVQSVLQQQTGLSHQPLQKRRRFHTPPSAELQHVSERTIPLQQQTWTCLAASIRQAISEAVSKGSAAACTVSLTLPADCATQHHSLGHDLTAAEDPSAKVMHDVPVEDPAASAPELPSAEGTGAQASDAQLVSDDAKEANGKRQRSSRRLGSSRQELAFLQTMPILQAVCSALQNIAIFRV